MDILFLMSITWASDLHALRSTSVAHATGLLLFDLALLLFALRTLLRRAPNAVEEVAVPLSE